MLLGAHVSIAGGIDQAPKNAAAIGCECFQIFSRSPRGGPAPALTDDLVKRFREACEEYKQASWNIHTPYYINLASAKPAVRKASIRIIREELERGSRIGATAVMTHLGSAKDVGEQEALKIVTAGIQEVLEGYTGSTEFLIEIAAGAGLVMGDTFEELAIFVQATRGRAKICFDTQHAYASGYDLRTAQAVRSTMKKFDDVIGLEHLRLSHCNDSLVPFGSHRDRHANIQDGELGKAGFRAIFGHPAFQKINFLLETMPEGVVEDLKALKKIRKEVKS